MLLSMVIEYVGFTRPAIDPIAGSSNRANIGRLEVETNPSAETEE